MTTIARRIASIPKRTSGETWAIVTNILAPEAGVARNELERASGVVSMLIADGVLRDHPLVLTGAGPQIRIFTVHDEDAVEGSGVSETPLSVVPTVGDWSLSIPVPDEDATWVAGEIAALHHIVIAASSVEVPMTKPQAVVPVIDLSDLRRG